MRPKTPHVSGHERVHMKILGTASLSPMEMCSTGGHPYFHMVLRPGPQTAPSLPFRHNIAFSSCSVVSS